jgi:hypothetical protein
MYKRAHDSKGVNEGVTESYAVTALISGLLQP